MEAISVKNLCFAYSEKTGSVIANLSLEIPAGKVTAILGANGAGKTTLLYLCLGLLSPSSGDMDILGKQFGQYTNKQIKQIIGMVPQNEDVPFDLNLLEYVLLGRAPYLHLFALPGQEDIAAAEGAIQTVGMERMRMRPVPSLSSGQRQLAAIARCLTQTPEILLFDEPTSHLDLSNSRRVLKLMKAIAGEGKTIVFTTHNPNAAAAVAGHVILLGQGNLIASGRPDHTLTEAFLHETYGEPVEVVQTRRGPVILAI